MPRWRAGPSSELEPEPLGSSSRLLLVPRTVRGRVGAGWGLQPWEVESATLMFP